MNTAVVTGAIALVVGTGAGLGAGAFVVHSWAPKERIVKVSEPSEKQTQALQILTHVIQQGASDAAGRVQGEPASAPPTSAAEAPPDPAASLKAWRESFANKVSAVQAEPRDAAWASSTEVALQGDFEAKAKTFEANLLRVECHSKSCLARVEWDSYATAQRKFVDIPHASYSSNCAISIDIGDAPAGPGGPHQATAVFQCKQDDQP